MNATAATSQEGESSALPPAIGGKLDDIRVIVLDDSEFDQRQIARTLKGVSGKISVYRADTVAEFAEAVRKQEFDFALIDFNLADGSGLDALEIIKHSDTLSPVLPIMVAGEGRTEVAVQAMKDGCKDYLVKGELSVDRLRDAMMQAMKQVSGPKTLDARTLGVVNTMIRIVNDMAIAEFRPQLSRMLRLIRQMKTSEESKKIKSDLASLDASCLQLHSYCEKFAKEVALETTRLN